jgi:hypothetical protein
MRFLCFHLRNCFSMGVQNFADRLRVRNLYRFGTVDYVESCNLALPLPDYPTDPLDKLPLVLSTGNQDRHRNFLHVQTFFQGSARKQGTIPTTLVLEYLHPSPRLRAGMEGFARHFVGCEIIRDFFDPLHRLCKENDSLI